jgi:hypothetical protein
MIIFGWGRGKTKDHGAAAPLVCPQCHNQTFYRYFSVTKWMTLFFIPVIPYSTKHFLVCPVCTRAVTLDASGRGVAQKMVELTSSCQAGAMSQEEYLNRIRGVEGNPLGASATPAISPAEPTAELPAPPPARPD